MTKKKLKKKKRVTNADLIKRLERKVRKLEKEKGDIKDYFEQSQRQTESANRLGDLAREQRDESREKFEEADKKIRRLLAHYHYAASGLLALQHEVKQVSGNRKFSVEVRSASGGVYVPESVTAKIRDGMPDSDQGPE